MDKKRTYIEMHVSGTTVTPKLYGALTAGMVGVPVAFSFDESWDELNKIAVFKGCTTKTRALMESNETTVPYESLQSSGFALEIGVEGRTADGTIVYPSVMKWVGTIQEGADSSADPGMEPSPTVYDDIMQAIGKLDSLKTKAKESLVAAINEIYERGGGGGGSVDPSYVERLVDEYLAENPPAPGEPGNDGVGISYIRQVFLSTEDEGTNVIEIGLTDGRIAQFDIRNGSKGSPGYTPQKGIDYYTPEDKAEMVADVLASLPAAEGVSF